MEAIVLYNIYVGRKIIYSLKWLTSYRRKKTTLFKEVNIIRHENR